MEKRRVTPGKLQSDENVQEKSGRRTKSAKTKTIENEPETSQVSSTPKSTDSTTSQNTRRRSARLTLLEAIKKQEDTKIQENEIKSPSKRKGKVIKVNKEVENSDSPRSKRTKSQLSDSVEKEEAVQRSAGKKSRKQKRQSVLKDDTQNQCGENIGESSDVSNVQSTSEDVGKKRSRQATKKGKEDETECDEVNLENSVKSDVGTPKNNVAKKKTRKSKSKESEAELPEKDTKEGSVVVTESLITSSKKAKSKQEKGSSVKDKTDGSGPDISDKSSERTDKAKKASSTVKSSTEDRSTISPTAEGILIGKDVSDSEVTFLSTKSIHQSKDHPEVLYDEVHVEDSGESKDGIEITHIKSPKVKSGIGKKSMSEEVVLGESSSESDVTFLLTKQKSFTSEKLEVGQTEIKDEEGDLSDSEIKCLTHVSKGNKKINKQTNSMEVAMEVEIKDEEDSNSEVTCLSQESKKKKKSKGGDIEEPRESENEGLLEVSLSSKKLVRKGKANREVLPSELKGGESFSKRQNEKTETPDVHSYAKSSRFSKEGSSSKCSNIEPVRDYNRSISEEISLLKPKTFAARRSDSFFRKVLDDQGDGSGAEEDSDAECRKAIMESAQRRIEQNLSTSESDSRLIRGLHPAKPRISKDDLSSDSGSAPDAVSFESARKQTADSIKNVNEHIKRERQRLKEKRKARLELLKQQKEQKLIRLKEKMASQEDASCSSSEESGYEEELRNARLKMKKKKKVKASEEPMEKENVDEPVPGTANRPQAEPASDDTSEQEFIGSKEAMSLNSLKRMQADLHKVPEEPVPSKIAKVSINNGSIQEEKLLKKKKVKDDKKPGFSSLTNLDYIPLNVEGSTKFMVVPIEKTACLTMAEEAKKFREENLFRWNKREPATENSVVRRKKRTAMKSAVKNRFM